VGLEMFSYEGKRALVVGGASGMGAAAARIVKDLGAEVIVMDYAEVTDPVDLALRVDLRDKASVDTALAALPGPIDALFSCAGVADGATDLMLVNFIAQRHIIDTLAASGGFARGAGITMISSVGGLGWEKNLTVLDELLASPDWDAAVAWCDAHPDLAHYGTSKQALNVYVRRRCLDLLKMGVRINAIEPGPTDTPLAQANAEVWLGFAQDYRADAGLEAATPEDQAYPMVFLNSPAAGYISGISMLVDLGYVDSYRAGAYESPMLDFILGGPSGG
jgi:NAD(P)-dependent dehydrogenase (short-subunit alcohol dehydrogenase family)